MRTSQQLFSYSIHLTLSPGMKTEPNKNEPHSLILLLSQVTIVHLSPFDFALIVPFQVSLQSKPTSATATMQSKEQMLLS